MPNIMTHALCAQDALQTLKAPNLLRLIQMYPQVYSMAASGPDFLFYYRTFPWQDQSGCAEVYAVGNAVHSHHINAFYQKAVQLIQDEKDPRSKDILTVFLAGHLAHWSLDTCAHPYVFFHTGEMKGETKYWHYRLESMIDTWMVQQIKGYQLKAMPSYRMVDSSPLVRSVIAPFYQAIVKAVYGDDLDLDVYLECLETMPKVAKLLFDPSNAKRVWIVGLEKAMKAPWKFSSHMIFGEVDTTHDILNLKHTPWNHPCDVNETSTESFLDLYEKAVLRAQACLYALEDILQHQAMPSTLNAILQDRNYDTGKANPPAMRSYRPLY